MFNVDWTDPGIEKVGERRARKEKEHGSQDGDDARLSKRASTSTRRSSSSAGKSATTQSTADKPSSWFGGVSRKKNRLSSKSKISHASDLRIPIPGANTVTPSLPTASTFCSNFSASSSVGKNVADAQYVLAPINTWWDEAENPQIFPTTDSVLSGPTRHLSSPLQSPFRSPLRPGQGDFKADFTGEPRAKAVKTFGSDRWIMKTTETLMEVTQAKTETGSDCTRSEVTVPAAPRVPADPPTPNSLMPLPLERNISPDIFPLNMYAPSPVGVGGSQQPPTRLPGPVRSRKTPRSPAKTVVIPPPPNRRLVKFRAHDPSRWKAPEEWDLEDQRELAKEFNLEEQFSAVERPANDSSADLASVQREIKKMALLVPASIVFRLDEKLSDSTNPAAYRETETERKRLMLHALGVLGGPRQMGGLTRATKILSLFESEATASYLAAIHPESSITHLSPSPLSALLFPNVRPLVSPTVSNSALPLPPNYFSAVYCLPLPSIMSSQEIPGLLRNIHTYLLPGGVLHLVLINPAPATKSLGPHMRQWMEDNLLLNLERQFRCTNPRKLIPMWLGDAGLRAYDSTMTAVKCQAVFRKASNEDTELGGARKSSADSDEAEILGLMYGGQEALQREQQAKAELQSRIGRLLWQETWGSYVNADRWWWDDPECVDECAQLGTYWEYSILEAVKDC